MPTTLLAVDDSVTMRKVLEMTFAGEDFRVITADSSDSAIAKLRAERPAIVLCDVTLEGQGGYGLCAKIKAETPGVAVLMLASKQQPYDSQKGMSSRADDYIEKPFDTQQLVDKVKRLASRPAPSADAPSATRPGFAGPSTQPGAPAPPARTGATTAPLGVRAPLTGPSASASPRPAAPSLGGSAGPIGRGTLAYGVTASPAPPAVASGTGSALPGAAPRPTSSLPGSPAGTAPAPIIAPTPAASAASAPATLSAPAPAFASAPAPIAAPPPMVAPPVVAVPPIPTASAPAPLTGPSTPAPAVALAGPIAATAAPAQAVVAAMNGQLAGKLQHLGLTDAQAAAVLALSREVVEKVVWEVVPVLAETMIKEEIKRLTSE